MPNLAFSSDEYAARLDQAQRALAAHGLDALIVAAPENICYLSGFWTPGYHVLQALVLRRRHQPFLVVRDIESDNVRESSWVARFHAIENLDTALDALTDALRAEGADSGTIGVEIDGARQSTLRLDLLQSALPGAIFAPSLGVVEALRAVKSAAEIACMRKAVAIAESALNAGARSLTTARTDGEVAAAVHGKLAAAGSEFTGSPPYVVAGAASARIHALHANRPLRDGEHVWMEVPASVARYHGVASRIAGRSLSGEARRLFDTSVAALQAMIGAMRPGVASGAVDAAGRAKVEAAGAGPLWRIRAAYSLGLSFPPGLGEGHIIDIKPSDERPLQTGMVFHLIPILIAPGVGAVGCTETVAVGEAGGERLGSLDLAPLTPDD